VSTPLARPARRPVSHLLPPPPSSFPSRPRYTRQIGGRGQRVGFNQSSADAFCKAARAEERLGEHEPLQVFLACDDISVRSVNPAIDDTGKVRNAADLREAEGGSGNGFTVARVELFFKNFVLPFVAADEVAEGGAEGASSATRTALLAALEPYVSGMELRCAAALAALVKLKRKATKSEAARRKERDGGARAADAGSESGASRGESDATPPGSDDDAEEGDSDGEVLDVSARSAGNIAILTEDAEAANAGLAALAGLRDALAALGSSADPTDEAINAVRSTVVVTLRVHVAPLLVTCKKMRVAAVRPNTATETAAAATTTTTTTTPPTHAPCSTR